MRGRQNPLLGRRIECGFVFPFSACKYVWQVSTRLRVRIALVLQSLLEICPQISRRRTALIRNFDLYLTKRWTFKFYRLTQCSPRELYSSNWSPKLLCSSLEIAAASGDSASCDTQLNCRTLYTIATTLLSSPFNLLFVWLFFNLPVRTKALCAEFTTRFRPLELTFGRMPVVAQVFHDLLVELRLLLVAEVEEGKRKTDRRKAEK